MICPHCKKAIPYNSDKETKARAFELKKEGYSLREIEAILRSEGRRASFSNIGRWFQQASFTPKDTE